MEKTKSILMTPGEFRTPEQLKGDVRKRDREWGDWERDGIQGVVNQLAEILSKNYPGHGWLKIQLQGQGYDNNTHQWLVYSGFRSAFGDKMQGLLRAVCHVFPGARWRVKASFDGPNFKFCFQPLDVPLRWWERRLGWIKHVAVIAEDLDCSKLTDPPTTLRPNTRTVGATSTDGVTVSGVNIDSQAIAPPFAYDNLC